MSMSDPLGDMLTRIRMDNQPAKLLCLALSRLRANVLKC